MVRSRKSSTTSAPDGTPNPPQPATRAVAEGALGAVVDRARWLDAADQRLRRHLPAALAAALRLANVDGDTVVLLVPTPAWKARLRLETTTLLVAAHAAGIEARAVTLKVLPPVAPSPARPGAPLSAVARATLEAAARSVADPELRAQLLRLAASGRRPVSDGKGESTDASLEKR